MLYTAEKQPAVFFATCARLLPNDVRVTVEQQLPGNLSMEDWQVMKEIITVLEFTDVQERTFEVDLIPTKVDEPS